MPKKIVIPNMSKFIINPALKPNLEPRSPKAL